MIASILSTSNVAGAVHAPPSKSAMQRALALALLNNGITTIYHPGYSNDDEVALKIIQQLGAKILEKSNEKIVIQSDGEVKHLTSDISFGESGLSMRMFGQIATINNQQKEFIGEGSLLKRPATALIEGLNEAGVVVSHNNSFLPIRVFGTYTPHSVELDANESSQSLTGSLIAHANTIDEAVEIEVSGLKSKAYIDLTISLMRHFGYRVDNDRFKKFTIYPKDKSRRDIDYTVDGDWSGAAFLLVAGAIAGSVTVKGLDIKSKQGDKKILKVLEAVGAHVKVGKKQIVVSRNQLKPFTFDANGCPDLFPPLVALAANCNGVSVIKGANRLYHKESNRAETLQKSFEQLGYQVYFQVNDMLVEGKHHATPISTTIPSHNDHRIAMAIAVAALPLREEVKITEAEAVNKSYPYFYEHLKQLGVQVNFCHE